MNSHVNHSLSHLNRFLAYEFEFTNIDSKFRWIAGEEYVKEILPPKDAIGTKIIDVSDVSQNGSPDIILKKIIKKVCRIKCDEEETLPD